ncbi:MAG: hypothetical protein WA190_06475 [Usitatibacter sp.]
MTIRSRWLAAVSLVLVSPLGDALAAPTVGGCPVFPSNNYWNTPVDTLPVHASSNTWVSSIGTSTKLHPDWGNVLADNYGIPYMTVDASQVPVAINFDPNGYADESDPGPMPIPVTAPVEGGSSSDGDRHVLVIDTSHCILYELYNAFPVTGSSPGWSVYSSAKFDLNSNALRPAGWTSADAAGLAIFPGLVRWDEIAAGEIAHAIRFTANNIWGRSAGAQEYLWPARHASGSSTDSTRPPMGARFRLKASFDISGFSTNTQVVLRAFKKYGLVLADAGSNWYFQGVSDTRFPDTMFDELKSIAGGNFEAVDTSVIEVDPNTAEAKQSGSAATVNVQGLWWNAPAGSESGWGINLTQQGDTLFATWFTYDSDGSGLWLVMPNGAKTASNTYTGPLYRTTGPAFSASPWLAAGVASTAVGTATFTFIDANTGTFAYAVNGFSQTKSIVRELFFTTAAPVCSEGTTPGQNYQGLWWNANESGWGVNLTHQADTLFATWFTYDASGKGLWLVMSNGAKTAPGSYTGALYRTTGPAYNVPFNSSPVVPTQVGTATFTFSDPGNGTFTYSVNGTSQSKSITRQIFFTAASATACN